MAQQIQAWKADDNSIHLTQQAAQNADAAYYKSTSREIILNGLEATSIMTTRQLTLSSTIEQAVIEQVNSGVNVFSGINAAIQGLLNPP